MANSSTARSLRLRSCWTWSGSEQMQGVTCGRARREFWGGAKEFFTSDVFLSKSRDAQRRVKDLLATVLGEVAVDTRKDVCDLLMGSEKLLEMQRSTLDVVGSLKSDMAAVLKFVQSQQGEDQWFTELLLQDDPALFGLAQQREKMLSLAREMEKRYFETAALTSQGKIRVRNVGSDAIRAGLCNSRCIIWSSQGCCWVPGSPWSIRDTFDTFERLVQGKKLHVEVETLHPKPKP